MNSLLLIPQNGVHWLQSGGIFAARSQATGEVIGEGMQAAKAAGAVNSYDQAQLMQEDR